jgi:hypothetical protein
LSASDTGPLGEPVLYPDGSRVWRFRAVNIPALPSEHVVALVDVAFSHGAVLVADGSELIVVERWQSTLSPETLGALREDIGDVIAVLRDQSRKRSARRELPL